jgi:hypothetical protein
MARSSPEVRPADTEGSLRRYRQSKELHPLSEVGRVTPAAAGRSDLALTVFHPVVPRLSPATESHLTVSDPVESDLAVLIAQLARAELDCCLFADQRKPAELSGLILAPGCRQSCWKSEVDHGLAEHETAAALLAHHHFALSPCVALPPGVALSSFPAPAWNCGESCSGRRLRWIVSFEV